MKNKLSQKDLIVLHLAEVKDWVPAYALKGLKTLKGWIGSEGDRRALEVLSKARLGGFYEVLGMRYQLEERRNGKYKEYRISDAKSIVQNYQPMLVNGEWKAVQISNLPTSQG